MDDPAPPSFGAMLRRYRIAAGLSQEALAERAGRSAPAISALERGTRRAPYRDTVARIADALRLTPIERDVLDTSINRHLGHSLLPPHYRRPVAANLPLQPTSLIGRDRELDMLCSRLRREDVRLVTVTGPAGVGKTRLALAAAVSLAHGFEDGVCFVDLSPISAVEEVPSGIALAVSIREFAEQPLAVSVMEALRTRHLLLVLDNCEQVIDAAPFVAGLLATCPGLKVMATSRQLLRLRWEHAIPISPLPLPHLSDPQSMDGLAAAPSIALFVQRAQAVKPDFTLTGDNARDVATICARLDGLPLAIELAAARVHLLPPHALLARLTHPLQVLTGGAHDLPPRHRSLRDAIASSYDLLSPGDQAFFRRLGVFMGGWTLEAAEALAPHIGPPSLAALDGLASLAEKNLIHQIHQTDGEPRFMMLETIREFALEQLSTKGELTVAQAHHAAVYLDLAEMAASTAGGPERPHRVALVEAEHANLRVALQWALEGGDVGLGLRLVAALGWFWRVRGLWAEGQDWINKALELCGSASPLLQARLYREAGDMALARGDLTGAQAFFVTTLARAREARDDRIVAQALLGLGTVAHARGNFAADAPLYEQGLAAARVARDHTTVAQCLGRLMLSAKVRDDLREAQKFGEEGLAVARIAGDHTTAAWLLFRLAWLSMARGDAATAKLQLEESLELYRCLDDRLGIPDVLMGLGELARLQDDYAEARSLYTEALNHYQQSGDQREITIAAVINLGFVALHDGDISAAATRFVEGFTRVQERGHWAWVTLLLAGLAGTLVRAGRPGQAVRLFSAAAALRPATSVLDATDQKEFDRYLADARAQLDHATFSSVWAEGRTLSADAALAGALADVDEVVHRLTRGATAHRVRGRTSVVCPGRLTEREVEILRLLASGQSNREIAETLVLSTRTVEHHLARIYAKLNARGRADAAAYAVRGGLVPAIAPIGSYHSTTT